ncbi:MAG: hypothetical protein ACREO7_07980 [Pseudoxanthomonas sp.]
MSGADRIETMRAELAPMTRSAAMGYGRRLFHGAGFDSAFHKMSRNPDGTPADTTAAAQAFIDWLDTVRAFAEIIRDKEGPAEARPLVPLKTPQGF